MRKIIPAIAFLLLGSNAVKLQESSSWLFDSSEPTMQSQVAQGEEEENATDDA